MPNYIIPYKNGDSGAFYRPDFRDYRFDMLAGAVGINTEFDWDFGYDLEEDLKIQLEHENQGTSLSCTGQGLSTYGEVLEFIETKNTKKFSPKRIYSQIYLPNGGAFLRDALKFVTKESFMLETDMPSYKSDGSPPDENFMRSNIVPTDEAIERSKIWQAKEYYTVSPKIDEVAVALKNGHGIYMAASGSNPGWSSPDLRPPKEGEKTWGHAFFGKAAKLKNGKKAIKVHNSWGTGWGANGDAWLDEDYFNSGNVWFSYVLIDKNNYTTMKLVKSKDPNNKTVYLIDAKGYRRAFYDVQHYNTVAPVLGLAKYKEENNNEYDWSQVQEIEESELNQYPLGRPMYIVA